MIKYISAKTILSTVRRKDIWFGIKYNMNLYRGCQHQCIYCDSRSECYQIENFNDILVKKNAIELLKKEISSKRIKGTVSTGAMNDPYMPLEQKEELTKKALQVIAENEFPVHILTKSYLVCRDIKLLKQISKIYAAVSLTITTYDNKLGKKLEPGASLVSKRFRAIKKLSDNGIYCGVFMMPILPFLEDNEVNIVNIIKKAKSAGAKYIVPWFGMTLRDRQRQYYYDKLDELFPGISKKYKNRYGIKYSCNCPESKKLYNLFYKTCKQYNMPTRMIHYKPVQIKQLRLI